MASVISIRRNIIYPEYYVMVFVRILYVLGSGKIRLTERKMNFKLLGFALPPAKPLQNELCLMKIGQSCEKIQLFELESQLST